MKKLINSTVVLAMLILTVISYSEDRSEKDELLKKLQVEFIGKSNSLKVSLSFQALDSVRVRKLNSKVKYSEENFTDTKNVEEIKFKKDKQTVSFVIPEKDAKRTMIYLTRTVFGGPPSIFKVHLKNYIPDRKN